MNSAGAGQPGSGFRVWKIFAAFAAVGLAALLWTALCTAPGLYWNPPRLASSFIVARGLALYPAADSGAQTGWFYPPVFALWYLPITVFRNPTVILMAAALLNLATIAGPLILLARAMTKSWPATAAGAMTGMVLWSAHRTTHGALYWIHIDAVCVACGLLCCLATWRFATTRAVRWLHFAALAGVAAMFTKQIAIPLPMACAAWLLGLRQPRQSVRFLCWTAIYGAAAALACLTAWGPERVIRSVAVIQMHTPNVGGTKMFFQGIAYLAPDLFLWAVVAFLVWRGASTSAPSAATERSAPVEPAAPRLSRAPSLITLVLIVAAAHLPLGLLAPLKAGGGLNSLHSLHYLAAALALAAARGWQDASLVAVTSGSTLRTRALMAVLWCVGLGIAHAKAYERAVNWKPHRGQEKLFALAEQHRGKIYFPWNPLITIITENKVYPFDDALHCLEIAGMATPVEAVRAAVPPDSLIFFPQPTQSAVVLNYLGPPETAAAATETKNR